MLENSIIKTMTGNSLVLDLSFENEKFGKGELIVITRFEEVDFNHVHSHNFIEIAYVSSGKGIHIIGDKQYTVTKGDLFIINYDVTHEFRSIPEFKDGPLVIYNCIFKSEFLDKSLISSRCFSDISHIFLFNSFFEEETAGNDIKLLGKDNIEIEELYEKMYLLYQMKTYGYQELLRAYLMELLVKIFILYRQSESSENREREKTYFDNVILFMKEHYKQDIKLDDLAAMAFLSRNYFCSSFKECTGVTVLEFIQKRRIEEACHLLKNKNRKLIEVAEAVGYRDLKFFSKVFKKITGKTPSEYRKSIYTV